MLSIEPSPPELLRLLKFTIVICNIVNIGVDCTNCTSGFADNIPNTEELSSVQDVFDEIDFDKGYYLFPSLNFQCKAYITRIYARFIVDLDILDSVYFQVWRPDNLRAHLVKELLLDFTADYSDCMENSNSTECLLAYQLPQDLLVEVDVDNYIGFYTFDNSLMRPFFYSTGRQFEPLFVVRSEPNQTLLQLMRNVNYVDISTSQLSAQVVVGVSNAVEDEDVVPTSRKSQGRLTILIAVLATVCCLMTLLLVLLFGLYMYRRKAGHRLWSLLRDNKFGSAYRRYTDDSTAISRYYYQLQSVFDYDNWEHRSHVTKSSFGPTYEKIFEVPGSDLENICIQLADREVSRDSVELGSVIGSGEFGMVLHGVWNHDEQAEQVAVKTLHDEVSEEDKLKLLREAAIIGQFTHNNIVKLCGIVSSGDPVMLLLEYLPKGDLLRLLVSIREKNDDCPGQFTSQMLLGFARDVGRGMNYLSNKCFIHRDLATRNILLTEDNVCKIADFGMSRDLINDYYLIKGGVIPVRWTAPEALLFRRYTTASDVWSYGVVLYEMWSLGERPFGDKDNCQVMELVENGYRLPPPPGCPRLIYSTMMQCWNPAYSLRPSFSTLLRTISQPSYVLFHWFEEAKEAGGPQCDVLIAPLEASHNLYPDLQNMYK